ncbi:MAG: flagellar basal body-associated FliL family protein [Spirochaetes bacterium]|nr:flagellar basal body-associated FliL family protein [Spirochaetota bacterium]
MADEPNDNINIDDSEESMPEAGAKKGKFLSPFIIRILTIAIVVILWLFGTIVLVMTLMRCTGSAQGSGRDLPQTETVTRQMIEHLMYLPIEDPFRQKLMDGAMVQLKISLGFKDNKKLQQELTQNIPELRDVVIKQLSRMKSDDFQHSNSLDELEESLIKQINRIINTGKVERIYFQEYTLM